MKKKDISIDITKQSQTAEEDYVMEENVIEENTSKVGKYWDKEVIFSPIYTKGSLDFVDEETIMTSLNNKIICINLKDYSEEYSIQIPDEEEITSFLVINSAGIILVALNNFLLKVYSIADKRNIKTINLNKNLIKKMTINSNQKFAGLLMSNNNIMIIDVSTLSIVVTFTGHHSYVNEMIFNPDKNNLILYSACENGEIKMFDIVIGK